MTEPEEVDEALPAPVADTAPARIDRALFRGLPPPLPCACHVLGRGATGA